MSGVQVLAQALSLEEAARLYQKEETLRRTLAAKVEEIKAGFPNTASQLNDAEYRLLEQEIEVQKAQVLLSRAAFTLPAQPEPGQGE